MTKRADQLLSDLYPDLTRSRAQDLIEHGEVHYKLSSGEWELLKKPGRKFHPPYPTEEDFSCQQLEKGIWVSRATLKLNAALDHFSIPVAETFCLDIGQSTGGFTQVLLQKGAKKVLGLEVGHGQLHPSLQSDHRVVTLEKFNARNGVSESVLQDFFAPETPTLFDLIVADVSFISLELVLPHHMKQLSPQGHVLVLVKPQFELGKEALSKKGVVKKPEWNLKAVDKIIEVFKSLNLDIMGHIPSPIEGDHGNQEFLLLARPSRSDAHKPGL